LIKEKEDFIGPEKRKENKLEAKNVKPATTKK
jgi:hypothetical protein